MLFCSFTVLRNIMLFFTLGIGYARAFDGTEMSTCVFFGVADIIRLDLLSYDMVGRSVHWPYTYY